MHCQHFLRHYSDYRDRTVRDPQLRRQLDRHVLTCSTCRRYDAQVARGVMVLRSAARLEPSTGFRQRLAARLAADTPAPDRPPIASRIAAALAVAATIATVALPGRVAPRSTALPVAPAVSAVAPAGLRPALTETPPLVVPAFGEWRTPRSTDEPLVRVVRHAP